MLSASACIPITLRYSGKAYRMLSFGQVLTFYGTIRALQMLPEGGCWQMISVMNWPEKLPAIFLLTIFTC